MTVRVVRSHAPILAMWLTRNGHGTGFWDRGLGERGDALTKSAESFGDAVLYVGDDGRIYQCGSEDS